MQPVAPQPETDLTASTHSGRRPFVVLVVGALGVCAATAQLALLRELLGAFSGNELSFGICLSSWLVLTAAGTWLGTLIHRIKHPLQFVALGAAIVSVLPIGEVLGVRLLRNHIFSSGAAIDPLAAASMALVVLAPFCLGSGAVLTLAVRTLARSDDVTVIGRVYATDAAGSVIGAMAFTFLLGPRLDHVALLCWPAVALFGLAAWIGRRRHAPPLLWGGAIAAVATALVGIFGSLDAWSTTQQYHARVIYRASSPYGRLIVTQQAGQITFFENGVPIAFTGNVVGAEEIVHYALAQRPEAKSVLLIGGAAAGAVPEILRYPAIRSVTCVELDPQIITAVRRWSPSTLGDSRCHVVVDDGRRYLQRTGDRFDAILVALPDPTTFQLNRFFTAEFFAQAKRTLTRDGVVAFAVGRYENYISPELRELVASAHRTVSSSFAHVITIPGARVFFIGSDGELRRDVASAVEASGVTPRLVNRDYLGAVQTPDRLADLDRAVAGPAAVNTDFHPVLYYLRLRQWLSQFAFPAAGFAAALGIILVACLARFRPVPRMVLAGGFAASALEVAGLVAIQVFYGSVYRQVGLLVGAFMGGLAAGAVIAIRVSDVRPRRAVRRLGLGIALTSGMFAAALPHLGTLDRWTGSSLAGQMVAILLTAGLAAQVGAQFSFAAADAPITSARAAPRLFSSDLVGAALGGIAVSAYLLPMYGLVVVCLVTGGLNVFTAMLGSRTHGHS